MAQFMKHQAFAFVGARFSPAKVIRIDRNAWRLTSLCKAGSTHVLALLTSSECYDQIINRQWVIAFLEFIPEGLDVRLNVSRNSVGCSSWFRTLTPG